MSTRGFLGFVVDGTEKIAYNHFDSYPDGLGADVLNWARANRHGLICDLHQGESGGPVDLIRKLRVVDQDARPTPEDVERLRPFTNLGVSQQSADDWYCLLRETQGDPAAMLKAGVILDGSDFPADSLFAEYGYVVDLDAQTFEAYVGFQREAHDKGRFASRSPHDTGYAPVALVASWPLAELPSEQELCAAFGEDDES